nr:muconolactone Delta-isomerase family protein [Marmoricola sp. URHB0036]
MEYLVEMTTQVPSGTSTDEVTAMRSKEAASTRELVEAGSILRLWRPPLQPGEWRTTGLFAARSRAELDHALESMPLHAWRRDRVTPLRPHPNDPGPGYAPLDPRCVEFFTTFVLTIPEQAEAGMVEELTSREAERVTELASAGACSACGLFPVRVTTSVTGKSAALQNCSTFSNPCPWRGG